MSHVGVPLAPRPRPEYFLIRRTGRETCNGNCKVTACADDLGFATDDIIETLKDVVPVLDIMNVGSCEACFELV